MLAQFILIPQLTVSALQSLISFDSVYFLPNLQYPEQNLLELF